MSYFLEIIGKKKIARAPSRLYYIGMQVSVLNKGLGEVTAKVTLPTAEGFIILFLDTCDGSPAYWCTESLWHALDGDVDEVVEEVQRAAAS